ncbi:MAG: hypothetical protein AAF939_17155 [Planctomycetota bacterium]
MAIFFMCKIRAAISPYLQYGSLTELVMEVESRTGLGTQDGFNDLVRESKMDFHPLLEGIKDETK